MSLREKAQGGRGREEEERGWRDDCQLRALADLPGDLGSLSRVPFPATVCLLTIIFYSSPREPIPGTKPACVSQMYMQSKHPSVK